MEEVFTLPETKREAFKAGLEAEGFTCRLFEETIGHTILYKVGATAPKKPNREARGCNLRPTQPAPMPKEVTQEVHID